MIKRLISVVALCCLLSNLSAQTKPPPAADDYNAIFKALKWRSIGPFRGGRSNCAVGVVGDARRKSKAYDDVENFPNKFTANYLFLINQTESAFPRVNQPSLDRLKQLNTEWAALKVRGSEILDKDIPLLNKRLWEGGLGAIWKD